MLLNGEVADFINDQQLVSGIPSEHTLNGPFFISGPKSDQQLMAVDEQRAFLLPAGFDPQSDRQVGFTLIESFS